MRRKSERTPAKKTKASPEKKVEKEKPKRTTRRGKKPSTSSENESANEGTPDPVCEAAAVEAVAAVKEPPPVPPKEPSPEEASDQVWQVKSAQGSGDTGEIQKLKICLTRPPSTPERVDRSPRSKRKHTRATSSSDTPSLDGSEEKKKKHKTRRATRESKDDSSEKHQDSQPEETEKEQTENRVEESDKPENEISQSTEQTNRSTSDDTPMSTTTEEVKPEQSGQTTEKDESKSEKASDEKDKQSDADTTVCSPENNKKEDTTYKEQVEQNKDDDSPVQVIVIQTSPVHDTSNQVEETPKEISTEPTTEEKSADQQVSKPEENKSDGVADSPQGKSHVNNKNDVVESDIDRVTETSTESNKDKEVEDSSKRFNSRETEHSESTHEESTLNGQAFTPIVVNRKRKWGSRPKVTTQKSITISTDVLKDIIPDVKPVEFDEVIEEKKHHHKRVEMSERIERPVLPKIVIDNTESIDLNSNHDEKETFMSKEPLPLSNRKISIVRDSDDIITRPLSPPRHKQSSILYISNLVRPFTLPQLKNLLQRTGRIVEDGFWIDKIKSRCFVIYENEDQAVETRHALHGVQWPPSNPKLLQVDFSSQEAFDKAKANEDEENAPASALPGTVEDWLREQDLKRERGELDKPWDRKPVREWDVGKGDKLQDEKMLRTPRDERPLDKRRHRTPERSPEPAKKFKKKEEEAPAKLLDDLFRKTKTTPCIYWLPLSAETIAVKEEQRRQHMAEHERRISELRRHRDVRDRRH